MFFNKDPVNNNTTTTSTVTTTVQHQEDSAMKTLDEQTQAISLAYNGKEELRNGEKSKWEKFLPPIKWERIRRIRADKENKMALYEEAEW